MFRLTKYRKTRISNRLAALGAAILLSTALANVAGFALSERSDQAMIATRSTTDNALAAPSPKAGGPASKNKRFKVSLFLFR